MSSATGPFMKKKPFEKNVTLVSESLCNCLLKTWTENTSLFLSISHFFHKSVQYVADSNWKPCTLSGRFVCLF